MGRRVSRKLSCTVLSGGKSGDNIKGLPIAIWCEVSGYETAHGRSWTYPPCNYPCSCTPEHDDRCSII